MSSTDIDKLILLCFSHFSQGVVFASKLSGQVLQGCAHNLYYSRDEVAIHMYMKVRHTSTYRAIFSQSPQLSAQHGCRQGAG